MKDLRLNIFVILIFSLAHPSFAGEQYTKDGYAVNGYDTVAYFTQDKPVKGDKSIEAEWNGAKWLFSSDEHKQTFLTDPGKYAPQYDGHCAYAAGAKNSKVKAVPDAWDIVDGKLYLNYSQGVQKSWLKKRDKYIVAADKNWSELTKKPAAKSGWF